MRYSAKLETYDISLFVLAGLFGPIEPILRLAKDLFVDLRNIVPVTGRIDGEVPELPLFGLVKQECCAIYWITRGTVLV